MASASNPLASLLGPALTSLSAGAGGGAGGPGGAPGGVPGEGSSDAGSQVSQMSSELHGADPAFLMRTLQSVKAALMAAFVQSGMRLPNVSGHLSQTVKALDKALKELQSAQSTQGAVRPPLGFSAATGAPSATQAGGGPMTQPPGA